MPTRTEKRRAQALTQRTTDVETESETPDKLIIHRPGRMQLSPEETRARMEAFASEREEAFVAAVRKDPD